MCSIAGYVNRRKNERDDKIIYEMSQSLKHRGPDDTGCVTAGLFGLQNNVAIAHNRLSIRDLSEAGHQPMFNSNGDIIIAFNGEIYNAEEFRQELRGRGYVFRSKSDTEILLYLYEEYGVDEMLAKIDGMYAICIVDINKDCIYLIRDKIGEKPLYTYYTDDIIMWASEYKAFYEHPSFSAELDEDNITEYLMYRYITDGKTLLKKVTNLMPGSYLCISKDGMNQNQYWDFPDRGVLTEKNGEKQNFEKILHKAFESRLVSDVEIGIQLSGGVDSSCLTKFVSGNGINQDNKVKTFSIIFEGKSYSEEAYIDQSIEQCDVEGHKYNFTNELFLDSWINTTYFFESPMNHEGTLGLYYLNKQASRMVKVILCGEGSDETMGGYARFYEYLQNKDSLIYRMKQIAKSLFIGHQFNFALISRDYIKNFINSTQYVNNHDVSKIYNKSDTNRVYRKRRKIFDSTNGNGMRKLMNYEVITYCQDLLMRADKVSMASSIEQRVPYLMPELVEYENAMNDRSFVNNKESDLSHNTKIILKEYCSKLFGDSFTYRRKQGFGIDLLDYFSEGKVKEYIISSILPGIKRRGILNYDAIHNMYFKSMKNNNKKNSSTVNALWTAFSFEIWCQMYLDRNPNRVYKELCC